MKKLITLAIICLTSLTARAQMVALGTDAVWDAMLAPNICGELVIGEKSTLGVNLMTGGSALGKDVRLTCVQPEYRYFFSGRPMHKEFVGVGAIVGTYDITWKNKVYDGSAYGAGLTFGYVFNITNRLNVDCHAGVGLIAYRRKEYFVGDHYDQDYSVDGQQQANASGYYLLPTRIGVSISYILK